MPYVDLDTIATPTTGQVLSAAWFAQVNANFDALNDREVAYVEVTAPLGGTFDTSETDLVSVTFTALAGRKYKITGHVRITTTATGICALRFQDGGSVTNRQNLPIESGQSAGLTFCARRTYSAGSVTLRLTGQRADGTGNLNIDHSAAAPAYLLVEDIGAV